MKDTHEFVENLKEKQNKDERNRKTQGKGNPSEKLPTNRHT
jgi:hypothetical protein